MKWWLTYGVSAPPAGVTVKWTRGKRAFSIRLGRLCFSVKGSAA